MWSHPWLERTATLTCKWLLNLLGPEIPVWRRWVASGQSSEAGQTETPTMCLWKPTEFFQFWIRTLIKFNKLDNKNISKIKMLVGLEIFGGHMSLYGATDTPVLDFWWCIIWASKPEWAALFLAMLAVRRLAVVASEGNLRARTSRTPPASASKAISSC